MYMHSNRLIYKQHYAFHVTIKIYCVYFLKGWLSWYIKDAENQCEINSNESEAAECPPPIARRSRNEARFISNALLFSEELKTEFVLCDGQLSFSHWILQVEPSPCLVATFSTTWTLPWQNRQDTDSSRF